jgi:hypothetical protein
MNIKTFSDLEDILIEPSSPLSLDRDDHTRRYNNSHYSGVDDTYADDFEDDERELSQVHHGRHGSNRSEEPQFSNADQQQVHGRGVFDANEVRSILVQSSVGPDYGIPFVDDEDLGYNQLDVVPSPRSRSASLRSPIAESPLPTHSPSLGSHTHSDLKPSVPTTHSSPTSSSVHSNSTISTSPSNVDFKAANIAIRHLAAPTVRSTHNVTRHSCGGFSKVAGVRPVDVPGLNLEKNQTGTYCIWSSATHRSCLIIQLTSQRGVTLTVI